MLVCWRRHRTLQASAIPLKDPENLDLKATCDDAMAALKIAESQRKLAIPASSIMQIKVGKQSALRCNRHLKHRANLAGCCYKGSGICCPRGSRKIGGKIDAHVYEGNV